VFAGKPKPRRSFFGRLLRWVMLAIGAWIVLGICAVAILRFVHPVTSAFMIERRIAALANNERSFMLSYRWTPWDQVSKQLPIALVAAEDQKFPFHHGFDVQAIQDAIADAEDGDRLRGASTISQQVAKNLFLCNGRSFVRKGLEAYFTALIELMWPKRRILEVYLNIAEFGDGVYGAQAASQEYFRKSAGQLNAHDAAVLASVLPNPKKLHADRPSAYVQRHADWVERQVRQLGGANYLPR